jgi:hypothetical protein
LKKLISIISLTLVSIVAICQDEEVITVAMLIPNEINTPSNLTALLQAYHVNGIQPTADFVNEKYDSLQNALERDSNLGLNLKVNIFYNEVGERASQEINDQQFGIISNRHCAK